jgi:hypothetical protein
MTKQTERATAIHEAGHAVVARVLGLVCGDATIIPDYGDATIIPDYEEGSAGCAIVHDPWATVAKWDREIERYWQRGVLPPRSRDARSAFRGFIITKMAGAEAEMEFLGGCAGGDDHDRREIEAVAQFTREAGLQDDDLWRRYEPRMRRQARRLIRNHRAKIERVARALQRRRTLTGQEIDRLMASRVAMHRIGETMAAEHFGNWIGSIEYDGETYRIPICRRTRNVRESKVIAYVTLTPSAFTELARQITMGVPADAEMGRRMVC